MANYNCILLDLDGTVWDFKESHKNALLKTFEKYEIELSSENIDKYNEIDSLLFQDLEKNKIQKNRYMTERFKNFLVYLKKQGNAEEMNRDYLVNLSNQDEIIVGADETVLEIAEVATVAAVTKGVQWVQAGRLKATGFSKYLDAVYVSEEVGTAKPSKKFFDYALNDLGVKNMDKVLVVGDDLQGDIEGGLRAGLNTCWINFDGVENTTNIKPNFTVRSFEELKHLIIGEEKVVEQHVKKPRFV